jgi:hypothetical protein
MQYAIFYTRVTSFLNPQNAARSAKTEHSLNLLSRLTDLPIMFLIVIVSIFSVSRLLVPLFRL